MKAYGLVRVTYHATIDAFWVNGESLEPAAELLVSVGNATFRGLRGTRVLCHGSIVVRSSVPAAVVC